MFCRRLTSGIASAKRDGMKDPYRLFGEGELCGWKTQPRVFIIQTRRPEFARKLRKRQDCSELATVGVNFYLRQFAVSGDWRKIRRLITRYLTSTGDHISDATSRQDASQLSGSIKTAAARNSALKSRAIIGGVGCKGHRP